MGRRYGFGFLVLDLDLEVLVMMDKVGKFSVVVDSLTGYADTFCQCGRTATEHSHFTNLEKNEKSYVKWVNI